MTMFRSIAKVSDGLLWTRKRIISSKNCWNAELYFGTKIEIPSPPKRPLTAYMIFCKENRPHLLKENPTLTCIEQIKFLAERWSHLTLDMKKPYEITARKNTLLYSEAHKKYYENLTEEQKDEIAKLKAEKRESRRLSKLKKALRDSCIPRTGSSAYALFVQAQSKNLKHCDIKSLSEFIKKVSEMWKSLPEEAKEEYVNESEKDKIRFSKELKEWKHKMESEGKSDLIKVYEEMKIKRRTADSEHHSHTKKNVTAGKKESTKEELPKN